MPSLDWIGKKAVLNHHREIPFRLLRCDSGLSVGSETGNLLVEGDSLHALKALLPYYAGRVKCIFIDPPYNTGNENWAYNDAVNSVEMREWLGRVVGKEREDLSRHDKWLCMMYPRLSLLKDMLCWGGSIWITIGEDEIAHLKLLCNEIFGATNFITTAVWQKRTSRENRAAFGSSHDYILLYAMGGESAWKAVRNRLPPGRKGYSNPDRDPRGEWKSIPFSAQGYRPNQMYPIETPSGLVVKPPKGRCWANLEPVFNTHRADNRVYFPKKGTGRPRLKQFRGEENGFVPMTWWTAVDSGDNQDAKKEILALFPDIESFETPKPEQLIRQIIHIATNIDDIVLDSFLGSGTTAAVAHKMNRRYIGIEMGEHARTFCATRLKKVVEGEGGGISEAEGWRGGGGFRYCTLSNTLFNELGYIQPEVTFADLAAHVFFVETGTPIVDPRRLPLLGVHKGVAIYLLYNGILGDRRRAGGNILTNSLLSNIPPHDGLRVIYGEGTTLTPARLRREGVIFKQVPYQVAVG